MYNGMEKYPLCVCVVNEGTRITKLYHTSTSLLIKIYSYVMYIYAKTFFFQGKTPYGKVGLFEGEKFSF